MNSILYKIVEIEKTAQNISDEAAKAEKGMPLEIAAKKKEIADGFELKKANAIKDITVREANDEKLKIERLLKVQDETLLKLKNLFEQKGGFWGKEIFESIIERKWR